MLPRAAPPSPAASQPPVVQPSGASQVPRRRLRDRPAIESGDASSPARLRFLKQARLVAVSHARGLFLVSYRSAAAALLAAAVGDWRTRTIPNWLNAAIALRDPLLVGERLSLWPGRGDAGRRGAGRAVRLLLAFQMGQMGGGDVKMLFALALWLPPMAVFQLIVIMAIAGGVLTIAMLIPHRMLKSSENPEIPTELQSLSPAFG
jgi:prepilin peptidase CpaA